MAKKKRNKTDNTTQAKAATTKADPREGKEGKYLSRLTSDELAARQKRKTIYMLLSTLFFGVSLFLPVEGRNVFADITWLVTLYLMFDILLIVVSVYVSYQGQKKHRIRSQMYDSDAPKRGFDNATYKGYELFNVLHYVLAAAEITLVCLRFGVWGAINIACALLSVVFSQMSRQILKKANEGNLDYLPPREDDFSADDQTSVNLLKDAAVLKSVREEQKNEKGQSDFSVQKGDADIDLADTTSHKDRSAAADTDTTKTTQNDDMAEDFYRPEDGNSTL